MTGRKLDPSERHIWKKVARTISPRRRLHGKGAAKPLPSREDFANMLRVPPVPMSAKPQKAKPSIDINQDKKTRRGQLEIDFKIDLHDMTQIQAKEALQRGLMRASNRNHKCGIIVTGKGARLQGVIRQAFPNWLSDPVISPLIASYAPAHIKHGGSGAWYVFLKRL